MTDTPDFLGTNYIATLYAHDHYANTFLMVCLLFILV